MISMLLESADAFQGLYENTENLKSATGDIYCKNCFEKTQERCFVCEQLIIGKVIKSNGKVSRWFKFLTDRTGRPDIIAF